jgi:CheY-like chemotaxis protein
MIEIKRGSDKAFLASLRHEFCTGLNAIIGYSEMLLDDLEGARQEYFIQDLQKIHTDGRELLAAVNDTFDPAIITACKSKSDLKSIGARVESEFRAPLNAIIGCLELLLGDAYGAQNDSCVADLQKIQTAAIRCLALAQDLVLCLPNIDPCELVVGLDTAATSPTSQLVVNTIRPRVGNGAEPVSSDRGHLLVVDDNEVNRDILSRHLERQGHTVTMAEDGCHALEMVKTHFFDLVLLDIVMPQMNGYQVLEQLKRDDTWRDIPVIMISALDEIDSVVRCIQLGAEDYLPKPFDPVLLRARISACLEKKRLRDQEIAYLQNVARVTAAAAAVEDGTFELNSLTDVAQRTDGLGQLARVFQSMARQVYAREQRLRQQVQELRIELNAARQTRQVAEITGTDYFRQLLAEAQGLREIVDGSSE